MTALAYLGIGAVAVLAAVGITAGTVPDEADQDTPPGYDPAPSPVPGEDERGPIVVNPGRDPL